MNDQIVYTTLRDPRARPLVDELRHEYDSRYGDVLREPGQPREMDRFEPEVFSPAQGGDFLLLLRDGSAIAGGAFMRHDERTAELKRMWTHSRHRRQGLAVRVLLELEQQVRRRGYQRIYLTTGFRQPEAVGLYRANGYTPLFDPNADPALPRKLPFEKQLRVEAGDVRAVRAVALETEARR